MAETVTVRSRTHVVCGSCLVADSAWTRFRGLMGRRELAPGDGLLLRPSGSVHTCFMRFPIDIVFLDGELEVVSVSPNVKPWRARAKRGARAVLELPAGEAQRVGISRGDRLTVQRPQISQEKERAHVVV